MAETPKLEDTLLPGVRASAEANKAYKVKLALESQQQKLKRLQEELYELTPGTEAYDRKLSDYRVQQRVVQQVTAEYEAANKAYQKAQAEYSGVKAEVRTAAAERKLKDKISTLESQITTAKQIGDTATVTRLTAELNNLKAQQAKGAASTDPIFRGRLDREYMGMPTSTDPWNFISQGKFQYSQSQNGGYFDANGREVYLLADPNGNLNDKTIVEVMSFEASAWAAPANVIKAQQKALGMAQTGIPTQEYVNALKAYASQASRINYSISLLPEADRGGRKAYTLDAMIKDMAGGAGTSRTTRRITQFSDAELDAVLDQYYAEYAGKSANAQQKAAFRKAARARAKAAPDVTTDTGSTVTTQMGFGETELRQMAQRQAVKDPASEAFLNSTKYLDEFLRIIDNPVA